MNEKAYQQGRLERKAPIVESQLLSHQVRQHKSSHLKKHFFVIFRYLEDIYGQIFTDRYLRTADVSASANFTLCNSTNLDFSRRSVH